MTPDDAIQQLATLAQQREEKRYAWLRHLLLLASGSLSVLVSLRTGAHSVGFQHYCIATALASLGLGILLGAVSLYGEVWSSRDIVGKYRESGLKWLQNPESYFAPVSSTLPSGYLAAEKLCYLSLVVSVISLVIYAIIAS